MGKMGLKNLKKNALEEKGRINFIFLIISMIVLMIGIASASYGTFKQNSCIQIKIISNSSLVNISSISYPNSSTAISDSPMTKIAKTFNYTFCNTTVLGNYIYDYYDNLGNIYVNDFKITYNGEDITIQQSYFYIIALIFLVLLLFGTVFIINKLPSKDETDEDGLVIHVSMLKHFRFVLWMFVWFMSMAIVFIISNIGIAYLQNPMIGNLFFVVYRLMFYFTIIGVPVYISFIFYKIFKDKEMKRLIGRGFEYRG